MQILNAPQGSPEWLAHRATHFNASDAPAMMGQSPYETREQLLRRLHSGIAREVDASTQQRFNDGHRFEALARPLAEKIIGDDLSPVTGYEGELSASFDGLTLMQDLAFEHKTLNADLRVAMRQQGGNANDFLPPLYRIQMEQQCMVSGAQRVLFMATKWDGEQLIEERHCWYTPDPQLRAEIVAGWKQFAADLANYQPPAVSAVEKVVAEPVEALPAPVIKVTGQLALVDNFQVFGERLRHFLDNKLIREPKTDQDFADLEAQIKEMKDARAALTAAEAQMLAQVEPVDQAKKTKDMLDKLLQQNVKLASDILTAEKERRKGEIVAVGVKKFDEHMAALNARLGKPWMPKVLTDFGGCIKNLRSLSSMEDKIAGELARAKIEANAIADKIQANMQCLATDGKGYEFLFHDAVAQVNKSPEDFANLVRARVAQHQQEQAAKEEVQRERIRQEEAARVEREHAEKVAREQREREEQEALARRQAQAPAAPPVQQTQPAAAPTVVPLRASAPAAAPLTPPSLKLGTLKTRIAPIQIDAAGLRELGFEPAAKEGGATLYHERDYQLILAAMVRHIEALQARQAA